MIASSSASPAVRSDLHSTTPPADNTATSAVPPPMSTTMLPEDSLRSMPAPIAANTGSSNSIGCRFAPAFSAACSTAMNSTSVTPEGTLMIRFERPTPAADCAFFSVYRRSCSAMS